MATTPHRLAWTDSWPSSFRKGRAAADALIDRVLGAISPPPAQPELGPACPVAPPALGAGLRAFALLDRRLMVPVVLLGTLFVFCFIRPTDPDWWWHLHTGRLIWQGHAIPATDNYSYTNAGRPWVVHEWLFEVLTYLGYRALGYAGLTAAMGLIVVATYTLHYLLLRALGVGRVLAGALTLWTHMLAHPGIGMRAHLFSYLFLSVELWCLYLYRSGHRRALWLFPPLTLLWVNLHGAWIMGLGTLALFILGEWLNARSRREATSLRPALAALAAAVAAVAINPQGVRLYLFPFEFIGADSATMKYVQEWQAPNFHELTGFAFGLTVMALVLLGLRRPRFDYTLALWTLAFTYLGFSAVRHIPLFALVVMPIIAQQLPVSWRGPGRPHRENTLTGAVNWLVALVAVGVVAAVMLAKPTTQVRREPNVATYPTAAVGYLRAHSEGGNLLNFDGWGGYLIEQLGPTRQVFIDTRVDFYGRPFIEEYLTVTELKPGWKGVLRRYDVAQVLLPPDAPLVALLREDPAWRVVLEDKDEVLLVRAIP
jgi:hypothetical protein